MNQRVLDAVASELTAAAAERWVVPVEGFLWRARRCAEAMLYALLVEAKVDVTQLAEQGKGLDNLVKHAKLQGVIPRAMRDHLDSAQKYGNSATHFQPEGPSSDANATIVANALSELARWFYTRDDKAPAALPAALAALIHERDRLRSPAEVALEQEQRKTRDLAQQLRAAVTPSVERPPPPFTGRLAALGVGLVALGSAFGFGIGWLSHAPEVSLPALVPTVVAAPAPTAPTAAPVTPSEAPPTIAEPAPVPAPVPIAPPGRSDCESREMRFVGVPGAPGTFCIDPAPVIGTRYRQCVNEGSCTRPLRGDGCNWQLGRDDLAVNCIPFAFAQAFCQQRLGLAGDLPTLAERNRAAEAHVVAVARGTTEWLGDRSDDGTRGVRGDHAPRDETRGYRDVSFRCVLRATAP